MPTLKENLSEIGNLINQIATESILAQDGSDTGLIPAFSLLSELSNMDGAQPFSDAAKQVTRALDQRLDVEPTWSHQEIEFVQSFVNWSQLALTQASNGEEPFPFQSDNAPAAPVEESKPKSEEPSGEEIAALEKEVDILLELDPEEDLELLQEFHTEANDHVEQIEAALLTIEKDPDDDESLNSLFRSFHTIKGVAGFLRLVPLQKLAHNLESVLDRARNKEIVLNSRLVSGILEGKDAIEVINSQIADCLSDGTLPSEVVKVSHIIWEVNKAAEAQDGSEEDSTSSPDEGYLISDKVDSKEALPTTLELAQSFFAHKPETTEASSEKAEPTPQAEPAAAPAEPTPVASAPAPAAASKEPATKPAKKEAKKPARRAPIKDESFIRVNTGKLDNLMDMVGELVIVQSQIQESASTEKTDTVALQRGVAQLSRITKELQHSSMALRMLPIKPTFQKAGRMVRDISNDLGKTINLETDGEETELDRNVIEMIGDPLVHMIRNAIDHGIEATPEERTEAGKPAAGTILLKAYHRGGNIVIEMSDDGRGIDADKIFAKAVERGIVGPDEKLSDSDKRLLIFAPGFSTAETVTDLSGRGVGMDVVRRNIESLRGSVEVDSVVGMGTTFRIKLPLTMAIIDGLVVRVGFERFILPTPTVKVALKPEADQLSTIQGNMEVLDLRGNTVPNVRLHNSFDIQDAQQDISQGILVIIETASRPVALLVDEMISKQEVVIKNLGNLLGRIKGVAGGAILGDGNIALILDPANLYQHKSTGNSHAAA
ncbi:MAG: chemotaxis protein CheA [Opitutales bacterium]